MEQVGVALAGRAGRRDDASRDNVELGLDVGGVKGLESGSTILPEDDGRSEYLQNGGGFTVDEANVERAPARSGGGTGDTRVGER